MVFYYQCTILRELTPYVVYPLHLTREGKLRWDGKIYVLSTLWFINLMNLLGNDMLHTLLLFGMASPDLLWIWFTPFVGFTPTVLTLQTFSTVSGSPYLNSTPHLVVYSMVYCSSSEFYL